MAGWPTSDASTDSEQSHHGPEPAVTVNLSGSQLKDPELVDIVAAALHSSGLAPERLVLEITESIVMQDTEPILETLGRLRDLGLRLAIDDFGTGYSSLSYLQKFPVDILKIDKSFVDGIAEGGHGAALTRIIIALGEMLSLRLVAEGIEASDQFAHLRALGCGYGQGYLFARPLLAADAADLIRRGARPVIPTDADDEAGVQQAGLLLAAPGIPED